MTDVRRNGQLDGLGLERFRGCAASDAAAELAAPVLGDPVLGPFRAAREEFPNPRGEPPHVLAVEIKPALGFAQAPARADLLSRDAMKTFSSFSLVLVSAMRIFRADAAPPDSICSSKSRTVFKSRMSGRFNRIAQQRKPDPIPADAGDNPRPYVTTHEGSTDTSIGRDSGRADSARERETSGGVVESRPGGNR